MSETVFDLDAYLERIGLSGRPDPTLATLRAVVAAHSATIAYENIDVLLGRPPKLDLASLQAKMVRGKRGGYCFEQNALLRAGLRALGFAATGMIARVVRGLPADAPRMAGHMAVRVDLPEGKFLVDVGFGNLTPTGPLALQPDLEQETPHETMRLLPVGSELVLQAKLGDDWENLWRLSWQPVLDVDYEVSNWFTATHPASVFVSSMIAARPGPNGIRHTFLNGRLSLRRPDGTVERQDLTDEASIAAALSGTFGLAVPMEDVRSGLALLARTGQHGASHVAFS
ncbi:MAG TPA: arylamine N-acetyltransferase [Acetobacteraceae bacterium]|nr:arylamine N-acetyltransferase [Acetobacteraceae bacterium]